VSRFTNVYDAGFMHRYPEFAEAMDASVDRAGVLAGLAFVPLRPRDVPGHAGRGVAAPAPHGASAAAAIAREAEAARVVNEVVARLREVGRVPDALATERRETIAAMTRFLLRHGQDSSEWKTCVDTAHAVLDAAARRQPPPPAARAWIEDALRSVGYRSEDARRLAEGLTDMDAARSGAATGAANTRSAREERCRERLATLPLGTQIGFSSRDGMARARLRYFYPEPGLLLLATEGDGQEALFEIDVVARQMAEGQAWVIRSRPADAPPQDAALAANADADRQAPVTGRGAGA
jgi:hypothetical protein